MYLFLVMTNEQSLVPVAASVFGTICAVVFLVGTFFRTPFGELVRALSMSLILVLQRTSKIRRSYPTWRYIPAFFGLTRSPRPFPPARNPWRYTPRRSEDPDFTMMFALIAMAFVGSTCGGTMNVPLIPTWLGALVGAAACSFGCTLSSARGDLCRTLGMRVVALVQELWEIQAELRIIPKAAVVSSQVLDKLMIFDRKHKVKDRFLSLVNKSYNQAMQTASQLNTTTNNNNNSKAGEEEEEVLRRSPREKDDDGRRRGRGDDRGRPENRGDDEDWKRRGPPRDDDRNRGNQWREQDNQNDEDRRRRDSPLEDGEDQRPRRDNGRREDDFLDRRVHQEQLRDKPKKGLFWKR
jgi:hypothetical protein